jgi:hypothetical protein
LGDFCLTLQGVAGFQGPLQQPWVVMMMLTVIFHMHQVLVLETRLMLQPTTNLTVTLMNLQSDLTKVQLSLGQPLTAKLSLMNQLGSWQAAMR